jgi:hypothetical protein
MTAVETKCPRARPRQVQVLVLERSSWSLSGRLTGFALTHRLAGFEVVLIDPHEAFGLPDRSSLWGSAGACQFSQADLDE